MIGTRLYFKVATAILLLFVNCNGQTSDAAEQTIHSQNEPRVGGNCETCELIYVGMPKSINAIDTTAGWQLPGPKLIVTGTVYKPDKKTPAPDIILYYWQT